METTALTPGTAADPALHPGKTESPAPMVVDSPSGTQDAPGEIDLDAELAAYKELLLNPPPETPAEPVAPAAPETPAEVEDEPDDDPETDPAPDSVVEGKPLPKNWRETARNDFEAEVFQMRRRNRDMTLQEAIERVTAKHGKPEAPAAAPVVPVEETPAGTTAKLTARQAELAAALKQASTEFDFEKVADLQVELAQIPFQIFEAKQAEQSVAAAQQAQADQAKAASQAKAGQV